MFLVGVAVGAADAVLMFVFLHVVDVFFLHVLVFVLDPFISGSVHMLVRLRCAQGPLIIYS